MKRQTIFVAFSNQKGGGGKSAKITLTASYFHYLMDKNVLLVDCDFPQFSIDIMRKREEKLVKKSKNYRKQLDIFFKEVAKITGL